MKPGSGRKEIHCGDPYALRSEAIYRVGQRPLGGPRHGTAPGVLKAIFGSEVSLAVCLRSLRCPSRNRRKPLLLALRCAQFGSRAIQRRVACDESLLKLTDVMAALRLTRA